METFKIEIQEFLSRIVEVKAKTKNEAISLVHEMYRNEEIVLDAGDYIATEIGEHVSE
ncbi:MAG: DpnD/PcfM family protein [Flavobacteriales bacterium]|nr:DpnD/PcfM family protein [Flavobacteriales bacterium]